MRVYLVVSQKKFRTPPTKVILKVYSIGMKYEIQESEERRGEFLASAVDHENHGEVYSVLFSGPHARERAEEYRDWKNSEVDAPKVAPQAR